MSIVKILPEHIISKIAAGEVIERPASVVKELLENALDAGATSLSIELKEAGKSFIKIKDNGSGIARDDLETIFYRHATSKITGLDDLYAIRSLGFRGEALYSVAAISDITLKSKTAGDDTGWEIHLRGGVKLDCEPCSLSQNGTEIEIRELFFNTPARKKFLKSNTTELHQILNTVMPYTLIKPDVPFNITHQGKTLLDLKQADKMTERIASALKLEENNLLESFYELPSQDASIHIILGDNNIRRAKRDMQFVFVNGRPVFSKSISYHMNNVYRLLFPSDVFPFFAVFINIPPEDMDVNIHPTKREVKLKNEQQIGQVLRNMCEQTLMTSTPQQASADDDWEEVQENLASKESQVSFNMAGSIKETDPFDQDLKGSSAFTVPTQNEFFIPPDSLLTERREGLQQKITQARYIGAFMNKYQLFEYGRSLFLIDQHAAQERITYEQLLGQMERGNVECQHLLSPYVINLTAQDMLAWEEAQDRLEGLGFSTTQIGEDSIAVHSHAQLIKDIEKSVRHLLAGENITRCDHDTIARRACRSSVMAGDELTKEQVLYQREELSKCLDPFICPHGRPTVIEMSEEFIDKQFLRK